jgi:hypothetical protein
MKDLDERSLNMSSKVQKIDDDDDDDDDIVFS